MNFPELLTEVYLITNRPDLEAESKSAIKSATLKAHQSDFYAKDIYETGIKFDELLTRQSLDYISMLTNWRALKYVRRVVDEFDDNGTFFTILTPEEVLDSYGYQKADIAYVAGRVLEFRSSVPFNRGLLGCYVNPLVTEDKYTSWVAEQHPYAIIHEAARRVFLAIGQLEEANGQLRLVSEEYRSLRMTGINDVGS